MKNCTLAKHAYHPHKPDKIYAMNQAAMAAAAQGEMVINATLGSCIQDDGSMMVLPTVDRMLRQLPPSELYSYAPIGGIPGFAEAVSTALFGDWMPPCYFRAIPTPGGCGALRHLVWNFLDAGDPLLTTDWCWNPYRNICEEHGRHFSTFRMFDKEGVFNTAAFDEAVGSLLEHYQTLAILLNTPGHNPTGYRMAPCEMEAVADIVRTYANRTGKPITVCLDFSYVDYDDSGEEARRMVECFQNMPENTMLTAVFSMSKSFTMPGIRCGAIVAFAQTQDAAEEFQNTMEYSSRSVWSNTIRPAQRLLVEICQSRELQETVMRERQVFVDTITNRGRLFLREAEADGLPACRYSSGFFVSIPWRQAEQLAKELTTKRVYTIPLQQGIRVSVCSLRTELCVQAAKLISETCRSMP